MDYKAGTIGTYAVEFDRKPHKAVEYENITSLPWGTESDAQEDPEDYIVVERGAIEYKVTNASDTSGTANKNGSIIDNQKPALVQVEVSALGGTKYNPGVIGKFSVEYIKSLPLLSHSRIQKWKNGEQTSQGLPRHRYSMKPIWVL